MIKRYGPALKHIPAATAHILAAACLALAPRAGAVDLGTHKGCSATDAQFKATQLFTGPAVPSTMEGNGALKMAFVSRPGGAADVYFVQKRGVVKRYNGRTATLDSLGLVPVDNSVGEQGLIGIAIRKDFLQKPYIYLAYSSVEAGDRYSFRCGARWATTRRPSTAPAIRRICAAASTASIRTIRPGAIPSRRGISAPGWRRISPPRAMRPWPPNTWTPPR